MRPIASDVQQMLTPSDPAFAGRGPSAGAALSPAEQHALRRSAPLTTAEFKAVAQLVDRRDLPLRRLLRQQHDARRARHIAGAGAVARE